MHSRQAGSRMSLLFVGKAARWSSASRRSSRASALQALSGPRFMPVRACMRAVGMRGRPACEGHDVCYTCSTRGWALSSEVQLCSTGASWLLPSAVLCCPPLDLNGLRNLGLLGNGPSVRA